MKYYIKPTIEQLDVELEQMMAESTIEIFNGDAVGTDGVYDDSRMLEDIIMGNPFSIMK